MKLLYKLKTTTMKNTTVNIAFNREFINHMLTQATNKNIANAIMASGADLGIILKGVFDYQHTPLFDIGEHAICDKTIWDYASQQAKDEDDSKARQVGPCTIVGFNPYNNTYTIEYTWCGKSANQIRTMDVEVNDLELILPADH